MVIVDRPKHWETTASCVRLYTDIYYYTCDSPSLVPTHGEMNPVHTLPPYICKIRFNIILPSTPAKNLHKLLLFSLHQKWFTTFVLFRQDRLATICSNALPWRCILTALLSLEARCRSTATCWRRTAHSCRAFHNHKHISCIAFIGTCVNMKLYGCETWLLTVRTHL
jgi:hypothetical protein